MSKYLTSRGEHWIINTDFSISQTLDGVTPDEMEFCRGRDNNKKKKSASEEGREVTVVGSRGAERERESVQQE